jgi:hypothetical protein
LFEAIKPTAAAASRFARSCDRNYSAVDHVQARPRSSQWVRQARTAAVRVLDRFIFLARLIVVVAICLLAALAGVVVDSYLLDLPSDLRATGGVALGTLALLVAVHLVSAELAADRLAGPIARATSVPLPLLACYLLAGGSLVLGQVSSKAVNAATRSAITFGLAAGFAVAFGVALLQLLARTDATAAAVTFAKRRRGRFRAAGRELGRFHARSLSAREALAQQPWVKLTVAPPIVDRRLRITAQRDGWLAVSQRRLRALANDDWWSRSAGRLWIAATPGIRVDRGQEVAALTGGDSEPLPAKRLRQAQRLMSEQPRKGAEDAAEAVAVLIELMAAQGASGNEAGGFRVSDATVGLIESHLAALRRSRGSVKPGDAGAPVPALRTAALSVAQRLAHSARPEEREILQRFVQRLLPSCGADDPFSPTLLLQIESVAQSQPGAVITLLWELGIHVAETQDSTLTTSWTTAVDALVAGAAKVRPLDVVSVLGHVTSFACYVDSIQATRLHRSLDRHTSLADPQHALIQLRVGGSAIRAGAMSVATATALSCRSLVVPAWERWVGDRGNMAAESLNNELFGHTLGPDPQKSLQRFLGFLRSVQKAVP